MATTEMGVRTMWSCRRCSLVSNDAPRCAVSDVASSIELRLCAVCRRTLRLDSLIVVEELGDDGAAA